METTMTGNWKSVRTTIGFVGAAALAMITLTPSAAQAQLNGENLLGDMGVKSGTQPEPGLYVATMYYRYFTDAINGPDGKKVIFDPTETGSQTINAGMPLFVYVSPKKILGGHYGAMAVMPFANGSLEAPGLSLSEKASTGASDLYVMPFQLGWHAARFDATAGVGFFAPTGRHTAGASDNLGKGMWSYELSGGTTMYFDKARSWSVAASAYWETHSAKEGQVQVEHVTLSDVKVGQLMTVEGGVGKSFLHGAASLGVAYYAQWKITADQIGSITGVTEALAFPDRHRVWGIGPDVTIPIATKTRLISLVNIRYLWEDGARIKTQGQSLLVTSTVPVGGIKIPGR
jgi:hypothetical protein